jgi:hypothetical protein
VKHKHGAVQRPRHRDQLAQVERFAERKSCGDDAEACRGSASPL